MSKIKVENECSRCPRKQERVVTLEELVEEAKRGAPKHPALQISIDGAQAAEFKFLCDNCRDIVLGYISNATSQRDKVSSKRTVVGKKKKDEGAAAAPPPPSLPPQQTQKPTVPPQQNQQRVNPPQAPQQKR